MAPRSMSVLALLSLTLTAAAAPSQPTLSARRIVDLARTVAPADTRPSGAVLEADGTITEAGLKGAYRLDSDRRSGQFVETNRFALFATGVTYDGTTRYRTDPSGGVHRLDGAFGLSVGRTDAWLARLAWLDADAGGAAFDAPARLTEGGRAFDVVTATPAGGQPVQLWFDGATHRLARTVRRGAISTDTSRFDDYRQVGGRWLPFHIARSSDFSSDVTDIVISAYRWRSVAPGLFEPPTTRADADLATETRVPARFGTFVTIEALLDGKGPFRFIVDTGAHNIITPAVAEALGLKPVGGSQSGGAGAGTVTQQDAMVGSVRLGAATLRDQHFYVIPLQYSTIEQGTEPPLAGMLGLELFERFVVRLDYRAGTLSLGPSGGNSACTGTSIPFRFDDDMPLVDGAIEGQRGVIAIDSGNAGSPVVQGVWASRVGLAAQLRRGIETTSFGAGGASTNWITRGGTIALGPVTVSGVDLRLATDTKGSFSSITEAANVGQQVLARFDVTFDYGASRMCLTPRPGYLAPPLNRAGMIAIKAAPQAFTVVSVAQGSDAAKQDIRANDTIVAIDGRPAATLGGQAFFNLVRQAPGIALKLRLERDGKSFDRVVILREP